MKISTWTSWTISIPPITSHPSCPSDCTSCLQGFANVDFILWHYKFWSCHYLKHLLFPQLMLSCDPERKKRVIGRSQCVQTHSLCPNPGKLHKCCSGDFFPGALVWEIHCGNVGELKVFGQNEIIAISVVSNKFEQPGVNVDSYKLHING